MNVKIRSGSFAAGKVGVLPILLMVAFLVMFLAYFPAAKAMEGRAVSAEAAQPHPSEPWTDAEVVKPADLAKEIQDAKDGHRPVVVCAGFRVLYEGGHVAGAVFHGPGSKPEGLDDLGKWARKIPRSSDVVVYCGCCPLEHCPNIRPAFEKLRSMGFQHLRVLTLPNGFAKDWADPGYPIEKASDPQKK